MHAVGFVEWAKGQVEAYADMFRKQVYNSDASPQTVEEAKKITHAHSKKVCTLLTAAVFIFTNDVKAPRRVWA